jgi:hypothetical protein
MQSVELVPRHGSGTQADPGWVNGAQSSSETQRVQMPNRLPQKRLPSNRGQH